MVMQLVESKRQVFQQLAIPENSSVWNELVRALNDQHLARIIGAHVGRIEQQQADFLKAH